jgi:2-(1,2-epoxy-1,2-dihydrophenyl)acetyl-CoA isomerase
VSQTDSPVQLDIRDDIAYLTFARPEAGNSINMQFGREFLSATFAIEAAKARAVVMTGQGKNFCFGGDLRGMAGYGGDITGYLTELTTNLHAGIAQLTRMDAPVIAAVNGTAAGAGFGLVLAADLAIAARGAKFAPAYSAVGLTPDAGCTFFLPRALGNKRALELFLTNRTIDAEQALSWGLVNQVVEDHQLLDTAQAMAGRLAAGAVGAFGAIKRLLGESQRGFEAQLARESRSIAARGATAEGQEGIRAFLDKRAPRFR